MRKNYNPFQNFYLFKENKNYYLYDAISHTVFKINQSIFSKLQNNELQLKKYPREFRSTVKKFLKFRKVQLPQKDEKIAYVTINFSNNCNLNCSYCFRNRKINQSLTKGNLKEIIEYVTKKYMPNAEGYIFSLGLTSEPFLNFKLLEYFDELIAEYGGALFSLESFLDITPKQIFDKLPIKIREKYRQDFVSQTSLEILNNILRNEELFKFYNVKNKYVNQSLEKSKIFSKSKLAKINREILNEIFEGLIKSEPKPWMSMWFMTNATLINTEFINFAKKIGMTEICVSIDGNSIMNDFSRKFINGRGTYNSIVKGIKLIQDNKMCVSASIVFGVHNANPLDVFTHLISLGISSFSFSLIRNTHTDAFDEKTIFVLLKNFGKVYDKLLEEIKKNDFTLAKALRETFAFGAIKSLHTHKFMIARCQYGNKISISSDGIIYHCDYLNGTNKGDVGFFTDYPEYSNIKQWKCVDDVETCSSCWARYLCGGTCYAEALLSNNEINFIECIFRKEMIKLQLKFYVCIKELNLYESFIQALNYTVE